MRARRTLRRLSRWLAATGLAGALVAPTASASVVDTMTSSTDWDPASIFDSLNNLTLTLNGLATNLATDISVTFSLRADTDGANENVIMSVDGFSFGTWLNDVLGDDTITGPAGDTGGPLANQNATIFTGTATIPQAIAGGLIADGSLSALFNFSGDVTDLANPPSTSQSLPEFASFRVSYETEMATATAPEPASLALLGLGLVALTLSASGRRRSC